MNEKSPFDTFRGDLEAAIGEVSVYFEKLISREGSSLHLATRLNGEVPAKMQDINRSLRAMLEDRLAEFGEKVADTMTAQLRIRYYEDKIESKLASEGRVAEWTPWRAEWTERTRTAGIVLTGGFSLAAVLAALKAAGVSSVNIPLYAASPTATAVMFASLAILSGVAATHPDKVPSLMERERGSARAHLAAYLRNAEVDFVDCARNAARLLDGYFEVLKGGESTTV